MTRVTRVGALLGGAWRATWGSYAVFLVRRDDKWRWAVRAEGELLETWTGSEGYDGPKAASDCASYQLEQHGCLAFVDGKRQDLAKFLAFEPIDAAEVAFIP